MNQATSFEGTSTDPLPLKQRVEANRNQLKELLSPYVESAALDSAMTAHENFKVRLPLVGAFSTGKTSLLNAFFGEKLFATAINPETCLPVEISYGEQEVIRLMDEKGVIATLSREQLKNQTFPERANNSDKSSPRWLAVSLPSPQLQSYPELVLVDMPGWESGIDQHSRAVDDYVHRSGAYILTVSADEGTLKTSLQAVLRELRVFKKPVALVITRCDKRVPEDIPKLEKSISHAVAECLATEPVCVANVSARKKQIDGFCESIETLYALNDRIYAQSVGESLTALLHSTVKQLNILLNNEDLNAADIQLKMEELQAQKSRYEQELSQLSDSVEKLATTCTQQIHKDLQSTLTSKLTTLANKVRRGGDISDIASSAIRESFLNGVENDFKPKVSKKIKTFHLSNQTGPDGITLNADFALSDSDNSALEKLMESSLVMLAGKIITLIPSLKPFSLIIHGLSALLATGISRQQKEEQQAEEARQYVINELIPEVLSLAKPKIKQGLQDLSSQIKRQLQQETGQKVSEALQALNTLKNNLNQSQKAFSKQQDAYKSHLAVADQWIDVLKMPTQVL